MGVRFAPTTAFSTLTLRAFAANGANADDSMDAVALSLGASFGSAFAQRRAPLRPQRIGELPQEGRKYRPAHGPAHWDRECPLRACKVIGKSIRGELERRRHRK